MAARRSIILWLRRRKNAFAKYGVESAGATSDGPARARGRRRRTACGHDYPQSEIAQAFRELARTVAQKVAASVRETGSDPTQSVQIGKFS